ncbi:germination protein BB [Paenibacillus marchantiophytorum]|uniref:Germination protein BB n=1 Tax=Paenibacillus marchantiophytorum TaxID=1619310 RepID=A0ABQ2BR11_9BACL|nr:GerAB/ArcD/ProY family transporter [Paenibacillus marchantiophytorum]GGI45533.1 germination protein BB [Paenibacillus marchantiophytorum]
MIHPNDRITTPQASVILANILLGVGILTLPRLLADKMKTPDGWITVIVGGLISFGFGLIMVKLCQRFPGKTFFEYSQFIMGKWVGRALNVGIIVYFALFAAYEIRDMSEIIKYLLLEQTPKEFTILVLMCVGVYLTSGGMNPIARMLELILPFTLVIILFSFSLSLRLFELDNLRPVLGMGLGPVLKGLPETWRSFAGIETMLFFTAFMSRPEKAGKALLAGIGISVFIHVLTVITVLGGIPFEQVATLTWPTISIVRSYELTGFFLERYESLLIVVRLVQVFTGYVIYHYIVALGISQTFNKEYHRYIFIVLPVIFMIAMYPKSMNQLNELGEVIGRIFLCIICLVAPALFLITLLRKISHVPK